MKYKHILCLLVVQCLTLNGQWSVASAQTPVYLDQTKDIEARVEDAIGRMTLAEKIGIIHAQSKFSSAGVKRLGMPDFWTDKRLLCSFSCPNLLGSNLEPQCS